MYDQTKKFFQEKYKTIQTDTYELFIGSTGMIQNFKGMFETI